MVTISKLVALLAPIASLAVATSQADVLKRTSGYINAVYFVNWFVYPIYRMKLSLILLRGIYQRNFQPHDLPASEISHVLYAFMNVLADGTVYVITNFDYIQASC